MINKPVAAPPTQPPLFTRPKPAPRNEDRVVYAIGSRVIVTATSEGQRTVDLMDEKGHPSPLKAKVESKCEVTAWRPQRSGAARYRIRAEDGTEGWIEAANVRRMPPPPRPIVVIAKPAAAPAKPAAKKTKAAATKVAVPKAPAVPATPPVAAKAATAGRAAAPAPAAGPAKVAPTPKAPVAKVATPPKAGKATGPAKSTRPAKPAASSKKPAAKAPAKKAAAAPVKKKKKK